MAPAPNDDRPNQSDSEPPFVLPAPPPLCNKDRRAGRLVPYMVLVLPFTYEEQESWLDINKLTCTNKWEHPCTRSLCISATTEVLKRLPEWCHVGAIPRDDDGFDVSVYSGIVISSNISKEGLGLATDVEYIRHIQRIMSTKTMPFWIKFYARA
ncbi:hypothetical protein D9615_009709 [Tricholomella constricta]|uniref:Uncharacterized protein n=1 Tax=Tricholomella constricta TaxID=117010 RepID=A0A8H5GUC6_9AGAR|nr:hypothetical protein D9615_009709 [Tricholomella constricta]